MHIITGGAGFIGSVLLRRLNELGLDDIVIVDNLGSAEKWRNLVKGRYADFMHRDKFIELVRGGGLPWKIDGIVHLGACSSTAEKNADFLMENNFHYSRDLALFALEKGARFICASSAATYGDGSLGFSDKRELIERLRPLNMYGYSKQLFDLWLVRNGLDKDAASLKFFNVYGPNEYHKGPMRSVALRVWEQAKKKGSAALFASSAKGIKDGEQKRDFVYVKDCAGLIAWLLLERKDINGVRNAGSGQARTFNDLAKAVFRSLGKEPVLEYTPMPAGLAGKYQNYTRADMSWLEEAGGKMPRPLEEGVKDYVDNYLESGDRHA